MKLQRQCALQTQETSAGPDLDRSWHGSLSCYFFEPKLGASTFEHTSLNRRIMMNTCSDMLYYM